DQQPSQELGKSVVQYSLITSYGNRQHAGIVDKLCLLRNVWADGQMNLFLPFFFLHAHHVQKRVKWPLSAHLPIIKRQGQDHVPC
ncbi:hypothetical protein, partial [Candidatus Magnetaquicoccus inordinatus]|uniref:hypothetical protein n=1 Tax=Candidatus Magnetaquicoccus inordinatus TaxID=2496818 RepID=UPI001D0E022B